jgi:hypothetical protein
MDDTDTEKLERFFHGEVSIDPGSVTNGNHPMFGEYRRVLVVEPTHGWYRVYDWKVAGSYVVKE